MMDLQELFEENGWEEKYPGSPWMVLTNEFRDFMDEERKA